MSQQGSINGLVGYTLPTADARANYGLGKKGEDIARAWFQFSTTVQGRMAVDDLIARSGIFNHCDDPMHEGARRLGLEILGLIHLGAESFDERE